MATDDDDAATLRERVRELEQTVAQQQDTIEQLMPSRRAILAGGAGLVGGAALTGQASAQSAAGQVGTSSEPVDVEAATVNAESVNTDETSIVNTAARLDNLASATTVTARTETKVPLNTAAVDQSIATVDTSNHNITLAEAGTYLISGKVRWGFLKSGDDVECRIHINGQRADQSGFRQVVGTSAQRFDLPVGTSVQALSANDTIDLRVEIRSSTDRGLDPTAFNHISVAKLG